MSWDEFACLVKSCRICGSGKIAQVLDLGEMPIPNGFVTDPEAPEPRYPLRASVCQNCWLMMTSHVVPPELMFTNYVYVPSTSQTMRDHFKAFAIEQIAQLSLTRKDWVLDIGSNDGTLLKVFKEARMAVRGVDPAANLAKVAADAGIPTHAAPFSAKLASEIRCGFGQPKLITCTNCLAHVDDLHGFMGGVRHLLRDDGAFVAEFPYLPDMLERNEFDTIYHEHLSYFALGPVDKLARAHGMAVTDVKRVPVHGGSMRVTIEKVDESVVNTRFELGEGPQFRQLRTFEDFAVRCKANMRALVMELKHHRRKGRVIAAWGASAKGNVLLNACDIGSELVDRVYDSIPYKHGRFTPGMHLEVWPEEHLATQAKMSAAPDVLLLTAWNFADEILAKLAAIDGYKPIVITAVPKVEVLAA